MRNLKKRVTALVLSLLLTVSYLPLSAIAAVEGNNGLNTQPIAAPAANSTGLVKDTNVSYTRYYFVKEDGTRAALEWHEVDGAKYFFNHVGYSVSGWYFINNEKYYFDDKCRAYTGTQIIGDKIYSFDKDGKLLEDIQPGIFRNFATNGFINVLDARGNLAKSTFSVQDNQGYYFNDQGLSVTGKQVINGDLYIFNDHKLAQGLNTDPDDASKKFFITNAKGERLRKAWSTDAKAQHYFDVNGFAVTGWASIGDDQYYFDNNFLPYKNGEFDINGKKFTFYADGKLDVSGMELGLKTDANGKLYFIVNPLGDIAKNQWQVANGDAYYFGDDTYAVAGEQKIDEEMFAFNTDNKLIQGLNKLTTGEVFYIIDTTAARVKNGFSPDATAPHYFGVDGNAVKEWQTIGDYKYYFDPTTLLPLTGDQTIDGEQFKFDEQGRQIGLTVGLKPHKDGGYIFIKNNLGVLAKNEWQKVDNAAYYFDVNGRAVKGKQIIGDDVFTFADDYKLNTGICIDPENGNIFFIENLDGSRVRGKWHIVGDAKYYFNNKGYALKGRQLIEEYAYNFGDDGKLALGLSIDTQAGGGPRPFYIKGLDGTRAINEWVGTGADRRYFIYNGYGAREWNYIAGELHYFNNGTPATGTKLVEGKVYTFDQNGKVVSTTVTSGVFFNEDAPGGGKYYYIAPNTSTPAINTWYKDATKAYYFAADGYSVKGRQEIAGLVYNFNEKFELITGLNDDNGKLFYIKDLSATRAKSEWVAVNNDGYYFGEDGYALKGRQVIGSDVNVFGEDYKLVQGLQADPNDATKLFLVKDAKGAHAKTEWFTNTDGKKYYFGADGYAVTGWQSIAGDSYYMDKDFQPVTGKQTIDNEEYNFSDEGKLDKPVALGLQLDTTTNRYIFVISPAGTRAKSKWQVVNSEAYYFDAEGLSVKGRQIIDEKVYFFTDEFKLKIGLNIDEESVGGKTAFFIKDTAGTRATKEWQLVGDKRYYFDENAMAVTGRQDVDGTVFIFNDDFALKTGLCEDPLADGGKKMFYVSPKTGLIEKNLWIASSGAYFYIGDDGYAVSGAKSINDVTYTFTADFTLITGLYADPSRGGRLRYITPNTNTIYKGWLTIDAKKYFFDFLGLAVSGKYYIDGVEYQFDANYQLIEHTIVGSKGIDVSEFQGVIDWAAVKADGVEYAIIRAVHWRKGGAYYEIDPYFYRNVMGAKAQGIKVGAYIYSYAFKYAEGVEEATFFANSNEVKTLKANGVKFDLPIFMDYEDKRIIDNTSSNAVRTDALRGGMITLKAYGYYPGFYMNENWSRNYVNTTALLAEGYDFWLAHFDVANHKWGDKPGLWQYTSRGSVRGIVGNVDMNVMYKNYPSIINPGGGGSGGGAGTTEQLTVYDLNTKSYITASWNEIVAGIVQNEVGNGLQATGLDAAALYKAQAVAARTWLLYQKQVSTANPQVGIKPPIAYVMNAVTETQYEVLKYNGAYINAAYGSASAPITNSSANMGWGAYPYLTQVDTSAYEPSGYQGLVRTLGVDAMRTAITKLGGSTSGPYEKWLTNIVYDQNGYCTSITVGGKTVSGGRFYENCYGLLSPNFKLTTNGTNGQWTFTTYGNGHCVGMSQWGARNMIVKGISYIKVLETYYPGAKVTNK